MNFRILSAAFLAILPAALPAQDFTRVQQSVQSDLQEALSTADQLRTEIASEAAPISRRIDNLETEAIRLRREVDRIQRVRDNRTVDLQGLENRIAARKDEISYLGNLISDYIRRLENQINVAETSLYDPTIREATAVQESESVPAEERFAKQLAVVQMGLDRIVDATGGQVFEGKAIVGQDAVQESGSFVVYGPSSYFTSGQSDAAGIVVLAANSPEPNVRQLGPEMAEAIRGIAASGSGALPFDPTLGDALKVEETKETLWEHIQKGGIVIYFILGIAGIAFLVAVIKWVQISGIRRAKPADVQEILELIQGGREAEAADRASRIGGPVGELINGAIEHADEDRDLIEEVMFEKMLQTQPRLDRFIPFIAVTAATAPLLGLLGTVTGMIKTFKLITVFGTGDARSLSAGISEALITTEFGLLVAIPSLIIHALLVRKTRGVLSSMEQTAVAIVNGLRDRSSSQPQPQSKSND